MFLLSYHVPRYYLIGYNNKSSLPVLYNISRVKNEYRPLRLDYNGNVLPNHPDRGPAAAATYQGILKDIAFRDQYSLQGDAGVATIQIED